MGATLSLFFPPTPTLTEKNLPSQRGKVFIVTGGTSGVGYELCIILYQAGAKVYLAGRSKPNADAAISKIKDLPCMSPGEILFLEVHLEDLSTIKPAVQQFTTAESRLDVLFNNAGVAHPPREVLSAQGHEMSMATNCLGPHLLTQLLLPTLLKTAAQSREPGDVRVVWSSSGAVDFLASKGGMLESEIGNPPEHTQTCYNNSKVGNDFLAVELARQVGDKGILSIAQNPGNMKTGIFRHLPSWTSFVMIPLLYPAKMGAYTELWTGLSPELGISDAGTFVTSWGRRHPCPRDDVLAACKRVEDGGTGMAKKFVEWCDKQIERFK